VSTPDPTGKRALFTGHTGQDRAADGKRALFSAADEPGGPVVVDCSRCEVTSRIRADDALRRMLSFSLWIPGRTYSRHLRCPACGRRSWVRVRLI
jgi:hypothetical protein